MKLSKLTDQRLHTALMKLTSEPLPLKTAFKLKGILKRINEEYAKYEEVRLDSIKRHCDKNEDGTLKVDERGHARLSNENMDKFTKELNELLSVELDIPTVSSAELGDKVNLSVADLEILDGIIIE